MVLVYDRKVGQTNTQTKTPGKKQQKKLRKNNTSNSTIPTIRVTIARERSKKYKNVHKKKL